jgi:alpha-galactosidase
VSPSAEAANIAIARRIARPPGSEAFPSSADWAAAPAICFSSDWRGENHDPARETEARLLWSPQTLYLHFAVKFRSITVFTDSDADGRRDQMWDRDVAEAFFQPPGSPPRCYKEFEISPTGQWIDLDIAPGVKRDLQSGLRRQATIDEAARIWRAELAIPLSCLVKNFDPSLEWRVNFYRVEGPAEPRFYSAWRPTMTPQPNFHVPEAFGRLTFA